MAELALGIIGLSGAVELCFKRAKSLIKATQDHKQADEQLHELLLRVQLVWARSSSQLQASRILESSMSPEERTVQQQTVLIFHSKLEAAVAALSKLDKCGQSIKQQKLRNEFELAVSDLEAWQERSEPSWTELVKTTSLEFNAMIETLAASASKEPSESACEAPQFQRALEIPASKKPVFAPPESLESYDMKNLPHSMVQVGTDPKGNKVHVFDTVSTDVVATKDARGLAIHLRESDPQASGTMRCKGIVKLPETSSLAFVFRVPDGLDTVRSMRDLLLNGPVPESLTMKLEIARQLVNAVYHIHRCDFVHKNICPETILSLNSAGGDLRTFMVALVGFQALRHADGRTNTGNLGDMFGLYQHPRRQVVGRTAFVMQHDIYSLGVCLLEIGLWESLLPIEKSATLSRALDLPQGPSDPVTIKEAMVALSRGRLRGQMGDKYSTAVETCLTCLDTRNASFGDPEEFMDDDGVEVGSRYAEKVLDLINGISF